MNLNKIIIWLILSGFSISVSAQGNSVHPIDAALNKCLITAKGVLPRAKCYSTASGSWKKAVADDYKKLLLQLSPDLQTILKNEQTAWERFREENEKFILAKYGKRKGSGYISIRIIELMKPYKERALDLESRFEEPNELNQEKNK